MHKRLIPPTLSKLLTCLCCSALVETTLQLCSTITSSHVLSATRDGHMESHSLLLGCGLHSEKRPAQLAPRGMAGRGSFRTEFVGHHSGRHRCSDGMQSLGIKRAAGLVRSHRHPTRFGTAAGPYLRSKSGRSSQHTSSCSLASLYVNLLLLAYWRKGQRYLLPFFPRATYHPPVTGMPILRLYLK